MRPIHLAMATALVMMATPALAQTTPSPGSGLAPAAPVAPSTPPAGTVGSTVDGTAPEKTGSTTATGTTKPPGTVEGPLLGTRPDLEEKSRQLDAKINKGICTGCK